jgi:hypothetical protein
LTLKRTCAWWSFPGGLDFSGKGFSRRDSAPLRFEAFSARPHCYGLLMWIVTLHEQYLIVYGPLDFNPMAEKIFLQILIRRSKQYWWTVHYTLYILRIAVIFTVFLQYFLNAAWQMCATIFLPVIYNGNFMVYIKAKRFEAFSARPHCYGLFMWIVPLHEQSLIVYGRLDFNPMAEKIFLQILIRRSKQYWWTVTTHYIYCALQ